MSNQSRNTEATGRRHFLQRTGAAMVAAGVAPWSAAHADHSSTHSLDDEPPPVLTRLTWAGVKIELGGTTILIDPILSDIWDGDRPFPIVPLDIAEGRRHVLITHTHNDHYDKDALDDALDDRSRVVCHERAAAEIASDGYRVRAVHHYQPIRLGPFMVAAVPAVDGFGAPSGQVSWIVKGGGQTVIHCGDSLWHGEFWTIGSMFGPFDVAFMPINGARIPGFKPESEIPGTMTPEQAVAAGVVLGAKTVVPIHYGHHDPDFYVEYPDAVATFTTVARSRGIDGRVVEVGEPV